MNESAKTSAAELVTAFEEGRLARDQYWAEMREQHRLLEQYTALVGRGDLARIEIQRDGLTVVFADGLRMRWTPSDTRSVPSVTVNHGGYEAEEVRALTALATGAETVLDIGANAGFVALRLARVIASAGLIHAFEPVPSTHAELRHNIALNSLSGRIVPHAVALGEAAGEVKFYVPAFHGSVAASARALFEGENREVRVSMTTLDDFATSQAIERIDLLKCDVEGAELFVLRGGMATIERTRPVLMLEMLRKWAKVYDYHPNDILRVLTPLGYVCYAIENGQLVVHPQIDDDTQPTNFFLLDPTRHQAALQRLRQSLGASEPKPSGDGERSRELARRVREHTLRMVHRARASHVGSCLSIADILAVLYADVLNVEPTAPPEAQRDRFILSKGHAAAALYATLAERGFFPREWLEHYCEDGWPLAGHVVHKGVPGVELSTGSLGHGLPVGAGMALAGAREGCGYRVFVLLSDGECDEGSVWEAALFAGHHRLDNLVAIVDQNRIQSFGKVSDVLELEPFADKWRSFGWEVQSLDGHDHAALARALAPARRTPGRPLVILAQTVKGKGVSFMENRLVWHYRSPDAAQLEQALREVGGAP